MRIAFATLGLAIVLFMPGSAQAACTIDQRIELARTGYNKTELDALCNEQITAPTTQFAPPTAQAEPAPPRQRTPDEVLAAATYAAIEEGNLARMFSSRNKCDFLPDRVRVNNNKKTFGGYYEKLLRYNLFHVGKKERQFRADRATGVISASISMTAYGLSAANETCYALLIRRTSVAPKDFDSVEAAASAELNEVEQALKAKGVEFD